MRRLQSVVVCLAVLVLLAPLLAACGTKPKATVSSPAELPKATDTTAATAVSQPTVVAKPSATAAPPATFEKATCPVELPAGLEEGKDVECGYLTVPEDRSDPASPTIRLALAMFHPSGAPLPDPIVYLQGGPGGSALEFLSLSWSQQFEPFLASGRDLILLDQRGVGYSQPALDCPKTRELSLDMMDLEIDGKSITEEQALAQLDESLVACAQDLGKSANLAAYNTTASAADVNDLRAALGYDTVNLWGTSYGTWLALEVLRTYPQGVRSAVIDSVLPPDVNLLSEAPANAARSMSLLFDACAADAACNAAYPDLRKVLFDTVEGLNKEPAAFQTTDPLAQETYDVQFTGDDLVAVVFQFLYATEIIPLLPQLIYDVRDQDYLFLSQLLGLLLAQGPVMSQGQQLSVLCHDEIAFDTPGQLEAALAQYPELAPAFDDSILGRMGFRLCPEWKAGQAGPELNTPVTSNVPTMVMAGVYDPITPPEWGRHVVETLTNGYYFEYPGVGHGASSVTGCPQEMIQAFWQDPNTAPDDACIAAMRGPEFAVPTAGATPVELEPFTNAQMGIQGLVPKGWTQANPGVYARGSSATDLAVVIEQGTPGTAQDLLSLLVRQLGLPEAPQPVGQRSANGMDWSLYAVEVQGIPVKFALGESGGLALVVLLQSDPAEQDALTESVYLPAIDALTPIQ